MKNSANRPSLDTYGLDESVKWTKKLIDACTQDHLCQKFQSKDRFLPTRLIEIPNDPATNGIRLRESSDLHTETRYSALSYCWGGIKPACMTIPQNFLSHLTNIPWSSVPQTFRDAVLFTQALHLEYIWIDSVCIIQCNEADWSHESTRMYNCYSNAFVTLAAASSMNCNGGLFLLKPNETFEAPENVNINLSSRGPTNELTQDFVDAANGQGHPCDVETKYPLLSRAWAFQERMVSPRVIFFTSTQLIWDCYSECVSSEQSTRSNSQHNLIVYQGLKQEYFRLLQRDRTWDGESMVPARVERNFMLDAYSQLQLSDPRDRLPAIAAIAEQILSVDFEDPAAEYLCGLCRTNMHLDLMWVPVAAGSAEMQVLYTAPSWSWASFPGKTSYYSGQGGCTSTIQLIEDILTFNDARRFGHVLGGHITIRGPIVECTWDPSFKPGTAVLQDLQILRISTLNSDATIVGQLVELEFVPDYSLSCEEVMYMADHRNVWLLQTLRYGIGKMSGALVLHRNKNGKYTRLGARLRNRVREDQVQYPWGPVHSAVFDGVESQDLSLE